MTRKITKIISFFILMTVTAVSLCACSEIKLSTGKEKNTLIEVEDSKCKLDEAYVCIMETILSYEGDLSTGYFWNEKIGSQSIKDYIKEAAKDELTRITAGVVFASKKAVSLTDEEVQNISKEAEVTYERLAANFDVAEYAITPQSVINYYTKKALYKKLYDTITADINEIVTEESTKVILANYVQLPVNTSAEEVNKLWEKIKSTKNLEQCAKEAGLEPVLNKMLKRGEINSNFDDVAFALRDGEISEVVESKDGLYIIECIDDKIIANSTANYNQMLAIAKDEKFNEEYAAFAKEAHMFFNNGLWNKVDVGKLLPENK